MRIIKRIGLSISVVILASGFLLYSVSTVKGQSFAFAGITVSTINGLSITTSSGTLTITNGKTASVSNTLTFTGTDGSSVAFGAGGTAVKFIGSGTAAMGTSSISSGACATVVTTATTGVATTDTIITTANADITAVTGYAPNTSGILTIYPYPTSGNVNYKVCNSTAGSITPGAVTLNFTVIRTM